ncbi:hypothetical protein SAMN04487983_102773 [Streptomyces sp. yr375]|uniref:hypothetical protein n=1 Tax=Streptomyces sp. yr375 TaxID=1761906 RepID=UPI0008AD0C0F|nr:hypothetical protein [Streptomyces sp. yr375]SES00931.1 hypothetical protein SAMN04487983_102773 [Streptomyces sp. yr375]
MSTEYTTLRVRVTAKDADTLRALLREARPDVGGRVRRGEDGSFGVDAYVSLEEAEALDREGVSVTIHEDATATGRARQAEVGAGDRFAPEDAVPHGLALKVTEA